MTENPRLRIGLISQWPDIKNAEYELLEKIRRVKGYDFFLIDYLGRDLASGKLLKHSDLDLAIALHHDTPKYVDCPTYLAVINPLEYLFLSQAYSSRAAINYLTHDNHVMAKRSTYLRYHLNNLLGRDIDFDGYPEFYPSASRDDCRAPCTQFNQLFYCGINWERLSDPKGRHDDMLSLLDHEGFMHLFGPRMFEGKELWSGFNSYQGEIPFDGISILDRINQCGASLVLSSAVHFANETTSSRIYESCAAGAVIITDDNPFIVEEFGDSVLYFKRTGIAAKDAEQIEKNFRWIKTNPAQAASLAARSQKIFLDKFVLELVLEEIASDYTAKNLRRMGAASPSPVVTVALRVFDESDYGLDIAIESIKNQIYTHFEVIVQCPKGLRAPIESKFGETSFPLSVIEVDGFHDGNRTCRKGGYLSSLIPAMKGSYLATIEPGWGWNYDHLSVLVAASAKTQGLAITGSYKRMDSKAPVNSCSIARFCVSPFISDFDVNRLFVDLPAFLVPKSLLDPISKLALLFEHCEALLIFMDNMVNQQDLVVTNKITCFRNSDIHVPSFKDMEKSKASAPLGFWAKVSSKLDNPGYEFKLLYDRIRAHSIDVQTKEWLASRAGLNRGVFSSSDPRSNEHALEDLALCFRHKAPREYYFARVLYKMYRFVVRFIPIHIKFKD